MNSMVKIAMTHDLLQKSWKNHTVCPFLSLFHYKKISSENPMDCVTSKFAKHHSTSPVKFSIDNPSQISRFLRLYTTGISSNRANFDALTNCMITVANSMIGYQYIILKTTLYFQT